jgi:hypothetical protein
MFWDVHHELVLQTCALARAGFFFVFFFWGGPRSAGNGA